MLTKTLRITNARNAKTLSPSHMKQCIMSESRFDFLRELVKNIPDVNVADDNFTDSPSEHRESSEDASSPQPHQSSTDLYGTPSTNGAFSINATNSNENVASSTAPKRSHDSDSSAGSSSCSQRKYSKQHSLDSLAIRTHSTSDNTTLPINYSIESKSDDKSSHTIKLTRYDSSPASYSSNNNQASPSITSNRLIPVTTTKLNANDQPIINFDFTQIPILPLSSPTTTSTTAGTATTPITPSKHSHSVANILKPHSTIELESTRKDTKPQVVPSISTDLAKAPLIKIDYSNFDFQSQSQKHQSSKKSVQNSHSQQSTTISSSSCAPIIASTSKPTTDNNSSASYIVPTISYNLPLSTISNTSTLEMDEDYDNI